MTIIVSSGVSTYVSDAMDYTGCVLRFNGRKMYDVNYCGDAALYYRNAYGGYDAFLLEGKVQRTDRYTQQDYHKAYDNTTIEFGRTRYITEITKSWELHTGYLKDDEAKRLVKHLFPSTRVWLHLLDDNIITPVVITDTSATELTYKNNGEKLVAYTIKVDASQTADRR